MGLFDGAGRRQRRRRPPTSPRCSTPRWCSWSTPRRMSRLGGGARARLRTLRPAVRRGRASSSTGSARDGHEAMLREALAPLGHPGPRRAAPRRRACAGATATSAWCRWSSSRTEVRRVARPAGRRGRSRAATSTRSLALAASAPRRGRRPCRCPRSPAAGARRDRGRRRARPSPSRYPDNLEALDGGRRRARAVRPAAPTRRLPDGCDGLVAGGGFPEVYAEALAANRPLLADVPGAGRRRPAGVGRVRRPAVAVPIARRPAPWPGSCPTDAPHDRPAHARLPDGARTTADIAARPGRRRAAGPRVPLLAVEPRATRSTLAGRDGTRPGGFAGPRLLATYLHLHLGARPDVASPLRAGLRACPTVCPTWHYVPSAVRKTSVYLPDPLKDALAELAAPARAVRGRAHPAGHRATSSRRPPADPAAAAEPVPHRRPTLVGVGVGPGEPGPRHRRAPGALRRPTGCVAATTAPDADRPGRGDRAAAPPTPRIERVPFAMAPTPRPGAGPLDAVAAEPSSVALDGGEVVAFVTLGDPTLYSTFPALADRGRPQPDRP